MGTDLESLRLLHVVGELGTIGAAARQVGMTQPAASARLRALEARYGLDLLVRSTRGSQLTEDGQAVAGWTGRVLAELEALETGVRALREQRRGSLSIAASLTIAEYLVPGWIGQLQRAFPDVAVGLVVVNSDQVVALVREGQVSVGFIEGPAVVTDLRTRTVGYDEIVVVVSPRHAWARLRRPLTKDELAQTPLVQREPGSGTRTTFETVLGTEAPISLQATSTHALLGAAIAGVGPAVVSEIAARQDIAAGRLVAVPTELDLRRKLRATWRNKDRMQTPVSDLIRIASGPAATGGAR